MESIGIADTGKTHMNTRDLQYVLAVAEHRSFSRAAQACHVSQSTLSGQIKKLEEWLGVALFERTNRRVMPTEVGESIIRSAARILRETDQIREIAMSAQDPLSGRFRIGAFPTLATYVFSKLVSLIKTDLPNLRLVLVEEKTDHLVAMLRSGDIDAALLAMPVHDDSLVCRQLFEEPFLVAMPTGHPLAEEPVIDVHRLAHYPLLLLEEGHCLRDQALDVCQQHGMRVDQDVRATGLETLRQMVRAGTGITLMPRVAVRDDDGIIYRELAAPAPTRSVGLFYRKTSAKRSVIQRIDPLLSRLAASEQQAA